MMRRLIALALILFSTAGFAHKPSDSYLTLSIEADEVGGQWDIALRDLDYALGLDANGDGAITWGELRHRHSDIASYAMSHLEIKSGPTTCPSAIDQHLVDHHSDGAYAVLRFHAVCTQTIDRLTVGYRLFFDLDPQHRGLLNAHRLGQTYTAIFSPEHATETIEHTRFDSGKQFMAYGRQGVWHIWMGYDHVLFLLSLLLPAVLHRRGRVWIEADDFRAAFLDVVKIVTAFTLAHSVTLSLAALGSLKLPSRWVETAIAASIIVSALNNLYPVAYRQRWSLALIFGLIHGLGFANVLVDLGLPAGGRVLALLGFNLGVELGQLSIVTAFLPLAFSARATRAYRQLVLGLGSSAIALLGFLWFVERGFNLEILGS